MIEIKILMENHQVHIFTNLECIRFIYNYL